MIFKQFIFLLSFSISGALLAQGKASDRKTTEHNHNEHDEHTNKNMQQNHKKDHEHGSEESHSKDQEKKLDHGDHEHASEDKHQHEEDKGSHDEHRHEDEEDGHEDHGDHDDHDEESFGENKAIQEVKNEGQEFRLSEAAINRLGVQTKPLNAQRKGQAYFVVIPKSYLVFSQNEVGLFVSRDRWFRFLHAEVVKTVGNNYEIKISEIPDGHELVTEGVPLLRVAQLEAMGKGGKGHVH
ncbi:MAG: hypothetical protein ACOH5I_25695 [Oligoflexus sp.]